MEIYLKGSEDIIVHLDSSTIAIGVVALALGIDKVLLVLKNRGIDVQKLSKQIDEMHGWREIQKEKDLMLQQQVGELHNWHNVSDQDGVKLWYFRRSFEESMVKLADNIEKQTESIKQHTLCIANQTRLWDRMDARLEVIEKKE